MKLQIKITKEIYKRSAQCGITQEKYWHGQSCAIAEAIRDIFPNAWVKADSLILNAPEYPERYTEYNGILPDLYFKPEVRKMIKLFDTTPAEDRPDLPEISFEIEIPDSIISKINIEDAFKKLEGHQNLKLIEA